jgi:O-antigen/teichoic acid export membrane protein
LGSDTAIYGVSTIVGRFLTFLLTPIYANILPPSELGIVATIYAYVAFLNVVYAYGMESAYMKYASTLELGDERATFSIPFTSVVLTSLLFSLIISWQSTVVAGVVNLTSEYGKIVTYAAWILCLDALAVVPFASLRMARKAKRFAMIKLAGIILNVICNVVFLIWYHMGVEGIFLSGVISSAFALLLLLPTILSLWTIAWLPRLLRALLRFGLPTVPAGIASMMIQVIDRPILEALTNKATVGVYQANYRLGIFMMLIVSMFDFAWRPFFFTHARDKDAGDLFGKILTYFLLLMVSVFLLLSFFLEDVAKIPMFLGYPILPAPYWGGLSIIPVILLAYLFLGVSNTVVAGIYIEKQTKYLPLVTFLGAAANIATNYFLIPRMGMMGAAVATLVSYALMALILYNLSQRFFAVRYEAGRILKLVVSACVVFGLSRIIDLGALQILWKTALLLLFGISLYAARFFQSSELHRIASLFRRRVDGDSTPEIPKELGG